MTTRPFTGTTTQEERAYEIEHRQLAKIAATEGFVLLKNENNILPLKKGSKIALYGAGASRTIKGGTGSGDVNERNTISIFEGLKNAGYEITTNDWIADYEQKYLIAREEWKESIWKRADEMDDEFSLFFAYSSLPFQLPAGEIPTKTDATTAIYVLSRIAGEGADRHCAEGDYLLTKQEELILKTISSLYENVIVVINTGGLVDLSFLDRYSNIYGLLQIVQPGMEAGNAFAQIISGEITPSGKMTDSWAYAYEDYPNSSTFSHNNKNVEKEFYEEGILVGYRYFDSFQIPVRYPFGYGLSYTNFTITPLAIHQYGFGTKHPEIGICIEVTNTGSIYSGKEVIQIYASCPQGMLDKEYRRLIGFQKTKLLAPNESQQIEVRFPVYALTSYCENIPGWLLEHGTYGIFVGNSIQDATFTYSIEITKDICMVKTEHICPLQEELTERKIPVSQIEQLRLSWLSLIDSPSITITENDIITESIIYGVEDTKLDNSVKELVDTLSTEQLIQLATGAIAQDQSSNLGSNGISVPGSAAQTSNCACDQGIDDIVLADGPAGLRLINTYYVKNNEIVPQRFETALEGGFLCRTQEEQDGEKYYQYCTAMPVGTLLAQTWNLDLIKEVGKAIAKEMQLFQVILWLAPGMNIHRNPLCGRNFEYYSEDPVLTGKIAAAMTQGVQTLHGCGTTIKHFACNNQEDNRMGSNSIISERTLREIYLKGFEIAVKESQPLSIMTSYNLINGIHAANHYDLCTKVARDEWNFRGVIMTDWTTTHHGEDCTASGCMRAGNDLVMPGCPMDHINLRQELESETLNMDDLKRSIIHLASVILKCK